MKILLVEDDTALREALEELLLREGYAVIKASDALSARNALKGAKLFKRFKHPCHPPEYILQEGRKGLKGPLYQ